MMLQNLVSRSIMARLMVVLLWELLKSMCSLKALFFSTPFLLTKSRGQALPIAIAGLLAMTLMILALFNVSQSKIEKVQLSNAADAAAYSGLVWQARALNYAAYTNRAMVANQVAIGQFVTVRSWTDYSATVAERLSLISSAIPVVGPAIASALQVVNNYLTTVDMTLATLGPILMTSLDAINSAISGGQESLYIGVAGTTRSLLKTVVEGTDSRYELTTLSDAWLAENTAQWLSFAERHNNFSMMTRKADLVMGSRSRWTRDRSNRVTVLKLSLFGIGEFWYQKHGETRLVAYDENQVVRNGRVNKNEDDNTDLTWQWEARDAGSFFHKYKYIKRFKIRTRVNEVLPLAWGGKYISEDGEDITPYARQQGLSYCARPNSPSSHYVNRGDQGSLHTHLYNKFGYDNCQWHGPREAERLAIINKDALQGKYAGLRGYREISDLSQQNTDPRIRLAVEVALDVDALRTTANINGIGSPKAASGDKTEVLGAFKLDENASGIGDTRNLASVSVAELRFKRPKERRDKRHEYGNLFNPYWIVTLVDNTDYRRIAWAARGVAAGNGDSGGALP